MDGENDEADTATKGEGGIGTEPLTELSDEEENGGEKIGIKEEGGADE